MDVGVRPATSSISRMRMHNSPRNIRPLPQPPAEILNDAYSIVRSKSRARSVIQPLPPTPDTTDPSSSTLVVRDDRLHSSVSSHSKSPSHRSSGSVDRSPSLLRPTGNKQDEHKQDELLARDKLDALLRRLLSSYPHSINDLSVETKQAVEDFAANARTWDFKKSVEMVDQPFERAIDVIQGLSRSIAASGSEVPWRLGHRRTLAGDLKRSRTSRETKGKVIVFLSELVLFSIPDHLSPSRTRLLNHVIFTAREGLKEETETPTRVPSNNNPDDPLQKATSIPAFGTVAPIRHGSFRDGSSKNNGDSTVVPEILSRFTQQRSRVEDCLSAVSNALETFLNAPSDTLLLYHSQEAIDALSDLLSLVEDLDILKCICPPGNYSSIYWLTETKFSKTHCLHQHLRTAELSQQSLQDDIALLQLHSQISGFPGKSEEDRQMDYDIIKILITSSLYALAVLHQGLHALTTGRHGESKDEGLPEFSSAQADLDDDRDESDSLLVDDIDGSIYCNSSTKTTVEDPHINIASAFPSSTLLCGQGYDPAEQVVEVVYAPIQNGYESPLSSLSWTSTRSPSSTLATSISASTTPSLLSAMPKLQGLLGKEDLNVDHIQPINDAWYLGSDTSPDNCIFDHDGSVQSGTVEGLVELLTAHDSYDADFTRVFLMTFKSFMPLEELFRLLLARFRITSPDALKKYELLEWQRLKQDIIKLRVLEVMSSLLEDGMLENGDEFIFDHILNFLCDEDVTRHPTAKKLLAQVQYTKYCISEHSFDTALDPLIILPVIRSAADVLDVSDVSPLQLAQELTIMESELYRKIKSVDCVLLPKRLHERQDPTLMNSLRQFSEMFDKVENWVVAAVLTMPDAKPRTKIVQHFIRIAKHCRELQNYSSMAAIVSGLTCTPIQRLKMTWQGVSLEDKKELSASQSMSDPRNNFGNYHAVLSSVVAPCVPFLGAHIKTLLMVDAANPDTLSDQLINFEKRWKMAEVIDGIQRWQSTRFDLSSNFALNILLKNALNYFHGCSQADLVDSLSNISHTREPSADLSDASSIL